MEESEPIHEPKHSVFAVWHWSPDAWLKVIAVAVVLGLITKALIGPHPWERILIRLDNWIAPG